MLDPKDQGKIIGITSEYWAKHRSDRTFTEIVKGKEPGHRMADYVDDKTVSLLKVELDTRYEATPDGEQRLRSMGDVWIRSRGIFNPLNVKAGEQEKQGQPNLVSMQKLLDYILRQWIDSYYLLIVKFKLQEPIDHKVYLVDLLDWIDYVAFDAGPGQIMLKERDFYEAADSGKKPASLTIIEKLDRLFEKFEAAVHSLFEHRKRRLERQRDDLANLKKAGTFKVDQSKMVFVP